MQGDFDLVTNTVRRISRRLIPVNFEGDSFHDEILLLCQNMEFPGVSNIHLEFDGEESNIPGDVRRYLYRIIQELIHNAFRHSAAWHIWVRLKWASTTLVIEVEDDGTAFAKETEMVNSLKRKYNTLRMRSQAIGADLRYKRAEKGLLARVKYEFGQ
jgi:signal transduction histidine kinase